MPKPQSIRLGVLVGSLRRDSISRKIAKALIERASDGVECVIIEIGDLPLYNQDLDAAPPKPWTRFRAELAACDALLFVTPEYNRSIPGCLKNATDIGSRPDDQNLFDGLPAGIVSVTPYSLGGFGANHALRQSFVYLNLRVMQQPEAYIGNAADIMGKTGKIKDTESDAFLRSFMTELAAWIDLVGAPAPATFDIFMQAREAASNAYINGDATPLLEMATKRDPASFFPPGGARIIGAAEVAKSHKAGAKGFAPRSSGHFEILASGVSGRLAYWTGIQHADARMKGKDTLVPMQLRMTEMFRFEDGDWMLVHRHADFIDQKG